MSTHNISFSIEKEKLPIIILSLPLWDIFKGMKNEFETAVVDEPSVLEPPKFYCKSLCKTQSFNCVQPSYTRQTSAVGNGAEADHYCLR